MGASKTHQYTHAELKTAKIGRALSHPARIRIIQILNDQECVRNIDLTYELNLVRSSVHAHLGKLKEADLISLEYHPNCYKITLKNDALDLISKYLNN